MILREFEIHVRRVDNPKVEIQSGNILRIAKFAADELSRKRSGLLAVEDSGLFIDALGSFPGPFTSYAYETIGTSGVLRLLGSSPKRRARFEAAIAVSRSGRTLKTFRGEVRGRIAYKYRGPNGFGFDPIFIPTTALRTFGEMNELEKNSFSHRMRGFRQLGRWFTSSPRRIRLLENSGVLK